MILSINELKAKNYELNSSLESSSKNSKLSLSNLELNKKQSKDLKTLFNKSLKNQKDQIKNYENSKKKFKLLKKYGEILEKIEKLLGLIPNDLSNLSLDELSEKVEELIKTRKRNELQFIFTFYQNLYSNSLQNLLTIEKDYQNGVISSKDALSSVKSIKKEIAEQEANTPTILKQTKEEVKALINLYEDTFSQDIVENVSGVRSQLKTTGFNTQHAILFEKLNTNTQELISNINSLSSKISTFEPQVDLTPLTASLQETDELINKDSWDADTLSSNIMKLENTTSSLTDKQIEKNNENEQLANEIKETTEKTTKISKTSMEQISTETFNDATKRNKDTQEVVAEIPELVTANDATTMPTTIAEQYANVVIAQADADIDFGDKLSTDPNAAVAHKDNNEVNTTKDSALDLHSKMEEIEQENDMTFKIKNEEDDDEERKI